MSTDTDTGVGGGACITYVSLTRSTLHRSVGAACLLVKDESGARPAKRLVRGGGDDVTVVEGAHGFLGDNETRDVGHVTEATR